MLKLVSLKSRSVVNKCQPEKAIHTSAPQRHAKGSRKLRMGPQDGAGIKMWPESQPLKKDTHPPPPGHSSTIQQEEEVLNISTHTTHHKHLTGRQLLWALENSNQITITGSPTK